MSDVRQTWTKGAAGWLANELVFDRLFAPVTAAVLDAAALHPGDRVLEVGCGSGALLEAAVRQGARAVGVDISPGMIEAARERVPEATVLLGDAQELDLREALGGQRGRGYDVVASRFGVMFFADPVAAFANLRRAAADGRGLLAFAAWTAREENPMFTLGTEVLTRRLAAEGAGNGYAAAGPGPTSLADPGEVERILAAAGWSAVHLERVEFVCDYGQDGSDGVEERLATILGTTTGRRAADVLRPLLGMAGWAGLVDEVRAELRSGMVGGVVRHPAATWLVTATA
ncbi:class I SAM-dependent methyltransferase [Nocardioides humi]|uniref:Class I SAM-dependent methyltransferase n=1 Tax=Nocardioides humi TaxID=449461 RepID=A0ABN2AFS2_9ACTN|nr:class I SAM-dependent methyltransferase [Nocardioides humi]